MNKFLSFAALLTFVIGLSAFTTSNNPAPTTSSPDLIISDVKILCNARQKRLVVTVTNQGDAKADAKSILRVRAKDSNGPTQACIKSTRHTVPKLDPGKSAVIRIDLATDRPNCSCENILNFQLDADIENSVPESDETNNRKFFSNEL